MLGHAVACIEHICLIQYRMPRTVPRWTIVALPSAMPGTWIDHWHTFAASTANVVVRIARTIVNFDILPWQFVIVPGRLYDDDAPHLVIYEMMRRCCVTWIPSLDYYCSWEQQRRNRYWRCSCCSRFHRKDASLLWRTTVAAAVAVGDGWKLPTMYDTDCWCHSQHYGCCC